LLSLLGWSSVSVVGDVRGLVRGEKGKGLDWMIFDEMEAMEWHGMAWHGLGWIGLIDCGIP